MQMHYGAEVGGRAGMSAADTGTDSRLQHQVAHGHRMEQGGMSQRQQRGQEIQQNQSLLAFSPRPANELSDSSWSKLSAYENPKPLKKEVSGFLSSSLSLSLSRASIHKRDDMTAGSCRR